MKSIIEFVQEDQLKGVTTKNHPQPEPKIGRSPKGLTADLWMKHQSWLQGLMA